MAFKLLLTDKSSALGEAIYRGFEDYPSFSVISPPAEFNWHNPQGLHHFLAEHKPSLVINTLAYTGADIDVSHVLAQGCHEQGVLGLHLSSYRVFGTASCEQAEGFGETDIPAPDDERGRNLLAAEEAFLSLDKVVILRLPWFVDPTGDNIFTRVVGRLLSGDQLEVSDICRGCPVTVDDVRRVVVAMILQVFCGAENWGVFHLHTSDACSEAEFADYVARLLEKEGRQPASIDILRNREYRLVPGCSLLTGSRCMNNFGIQLRSWKQGIKPLVQAWLATHPQENPAR